MAPRLERIPRRPHTVPFAALVAPAALAGLALVALCACAGPQVASVGPTEPHPAPPGAIARPYVQAGTIFSAKLDQPLDSYESPPGTRFSATVVDPLRASDGRVLVPYGARVTGVLVSTGKGAEPRVRVQLQTVDTVAGTLPLQATLRAAQHVDWVGPEATAPRPDYGLLESGWNGAPPAPSATVVEPGGAQDRALPREIRVPRGALLELELVQPLVSPR